MNTQPFNAVTGATINITAAAGNVTSGSAIFTGGGYRQVRVMNDGTATVWVKFGPSGVTASTTADIPVPASGVEVFTVAAEANGTYAAINAAGATGKCYFTPGSGI